MPAATTCPDLGQYRLLIAGQLPAPAVEILLTHLEGCEACAREVAAVADQDTLVELVRTARTQAEEVHNERLSLLMQRLRQRQQGAPRSAEETVPPQEVIADPFATAGTPSDPPARADHTLAQAEPASAKNAKVDDRTRELTEFLAPPQGPEELGRLGSYRILKVLGYGGMGVVYMAEDPQLKRIVALKAMLPGFGASSSAEKRFLREAQSAAALKHDHIVSIYQVGEDRGAPFLAMEFLEGEPLDERLKRESLLPLAEVLRIGREVALGLAAAHKRDLIHRDIKPANLWLDADTGRVKILDFGLARAASEEANLTQSGAIVGTPAYMAPEQAQGKQIDARCDLFSLGCVLYRLCTGSMPFKGTDAISTLMAVATEVPPAPRQLNREMPQALSDLVMRLLAKKPEARPQSAREVAEQLQKLAEQLPPPPKAAPQPKPPQPVVPAAAAPPRSWTPTLVATVVLVLLLGVGAYFLAPLLFRVETPQGTLVVEIDEKEADNVRLSVKQGGKQIELLDLKTNKQITLNAGAYELELVGGKDGLKLATKQFELRRGERPIVKVTFEPRVAANAAPGKEAGPKLDPDKKLDPVVVPQVTLGRERATLQGHTSRVSSVAFSGDGKTLASGSDDKTIKLWDVATGKEKATLKGHTKDVNSVAFSSDGKTLASGSNDATIKLWDVATGKEEATLKGHTRDVYSVAFSRDGKTLASGSLDWTIKLWDVATGKEEIALKGHTNQVDSVAFSSDGKTLASGSNDATIKLWDVATGKEEATLKGHTRDVYSVAFSSDGKTLASGSYDKTIKLWDLTTEQEKTSLMGHKGGLRSVAFSGDGKTLASGSDDMRIKLWDVANGKEKATLKGHTRDVYSVAFSSDGKTLASGSADNTIKLWDVSGLDAAQVAKQPDPLPPPPVALGREKATLQGHTKGVSSVALSGDGKTLASGSEDNTIKLWDVISGKEKTTLTGHTSAVRSVKLSGDGNTLASGSEDNTIKLWDLASGKEKTTLTGHTYGVRSVAFSGDGKTLASGAADGNIKLWDVAGGQEKATFNGRTILVRSVALSPDGQTLASSDENMIQMWDVASGLKKATLKGHMDRVYSVAFSDDGKTVASGSGDKTIKLWDVASGKVKATLEGHTGVVMSVAFSGDGQTLASSGVDEWIRLWDVASGKQKVILHAAHSNSVAFSDDGKTLASGDASNSIKLWDVSGLDVFQMEPGFTSLFNGKNLDGWRQNKDKESLDGKTEACAGRFKVVDGMLIIDPAVKGDVYIETVRDFGKDVHIKFDFNPGPQCNNGIFLHGTKFDIIPGNKVNKNVKEGQWHTLEIIGKEYSNEYKINGETVRLIAAPLQPSPIRLYAKFGAIQIKNIRVKE